MFNPDKGFPGMEAATPDKEKELPYKKNFEAMMRIVKGEIGELLPRQEERAQKIFNECVNAGLIPESPEKSEEIINKILDDLKNPDLNDNQEEIINKEAPSGPKRETSATGASFSG